MIRGSAPLAEVSELRAGYGGVNNRTHLSSLELHNLHLSHLRPQ